MSALTTCRRWLGRSGSRGRLDPEIYAHTFVWDNFPPRFRTSYDPQFFAKILVSAVKVSHDLANPKSERPVCIAQEIIVNAICKYAYDETQVSLLTWVWRATGLSRCLPASPVPRVRHLREAAHPVLVAVPELVAARAERLRADGQKLHPDLTDRRPASRA
jgi:hypothetical protein